MRLSSNRHLVWLLGNGFNYSVINFINGGDQDLYKELNNLVELWNEFNVVFKRIKQEFSTRLGGKNAEEILQFIFDSIKILSAIEWQSTKYKDLFVFQEDCRGFNFDLCMSCLSEYIKSNISNSICDIVKNFIESETNNLYKRIFNFIGDELEKLNKYRKEQLANIQDREIFFTTNYDGIGEMILPYYEKKSERFIKARDGFGNCSDKEEQLCYLYDIQNKDTGLFLHLHSSYKYLSTYNGPVKIKQDSYEKVKEKICVGGLIPIIVFGEPSGKEKYINEHLPLSDYFKKFKDIMKKDNNTLIIWGQSLRTDPHIVKVIGDNFNKLHSIVIVDTDPDSVENKIFEGASISDSSKIKKINPDTAEFKSFEEMVRGIYEKALE